jgi:hypothetical protein
MSEILEKIKAAVAKYKPYEAPGEDWNLYDYVGSNIDAAFGLGFSDGQSLLADEIREILKGA